MSSDFYTFGEPVRFKSLKYRRAIEFIDAVNKHNYAKLRMILKKDGLECVEFDASPERPTRPVADIRKVERICVIFEEDENQKPCVLALRKSFPSTLLHLYLGDYGGSRSLCLFEEDYRSFAHTLTPENFLLRIFSWLSRAASGEQHLPDQPLEPFVIASEKMIFDPMDLAQDFRDRLLAIFLLEEKPNPIYRVQSIPLKDLPKPPCFIAVPIITDPWHSRIINDTPTSLAQLDILLRQVGVRLIDELQVKTIETFGKKFHEILMDYSWALILILPKKREDKAEIESFEHLAFFVLETIGSLGQKLGVLAKNNESWGRIIGDATPTALEGCLIKAIRPICSFNKILANKLAGLKMESTVKITAVGVGAIGSHVVFNLARQGLGRWFIIDNDQLLPHNHSRFALSPQYEGKNKAEVLSLEIVTLLNDESAAKGFARDVFSFDKNIQEEKECLSDVKHIFDFSASSGVSSHLALLPDISPITSVFLLQEGRVLIIISEGIQQKIRLDDLEVQLSVATIENADLSGLLRATGGPIIRYSGACRDVTTILPQDVVATQAGIASQFLKKNLSNESGSINVWSLSEENLEISRISVETQSVIVKSVGEWEVRVSQRTVNLMRKYRKAKLPNETGGVLLGCMNVSAKIVYVGTVLPSPRDSEEWPTVYIRGFSGLRKNVERIKAETGQNLTYVGEWHSHAGAVSAHPSEDDIKAHSKFANEMGKEGYPGVMLIQGSRGYPCVLLRHRGQYQYV